MRQLYLGSREIVTRTPKSHIHEGVTDSLLREALSHICSRRRKFIVKSIEMGRIVGYNHCVPTTDDDEIRYARRYQRRDYSRFVLNRDPVPCSKVVVVLRKARNQRLKYELVSTYIGELSRLPGAKAVEFWMQHALVLGTTPIDERSVTITPPEKWVSQITELTAR